MVNEIDPKNQNQHDANIADKVLVFDFMAKKRGMLLLFLGVVMLTMPLEAINQESTPAWTLDFKET